MWINVSKFCTPRSNPLILFDCCSNEPKYCMSVAALLVCIPQSQEKDCPVITGVTYMIVLIAPSNNQLPRKYLLTTNANLVEVLTEKDSKFKTKLMLATSLSFLCAVDSMG